MQVIHRISKDDRDESLSLIAFLGDVVNEIFLKYSKEGRLSSNQTGIHNIPSMFGMMTKNITGYNLNTGVFRTPYNIRTPCNI